jgi:hypothetical protein
VSATAAASVPIGHPPREPWRSIILTTRRPSSRGRPSCALTQRADLEGEHRPRLVLDYCLDEPALVAEAVVELALARPLVGHHVVQARRGRPALADQPRVDPGALMAGSRGVLRFRAPNEPRHRWG